MATSYQRRPDGKAPDPKALVKPDAELRADLQKLDEQKKALEQRGEKADAMDADLAAKLQPSMGNAALAGLLNRGTETATAAGEAALEEKQKEDDKEEEGEDKEAGEIEHVLPSFSTGGGGGGGSQPPWAMARELGGDDDADADVLAVDGPKWRPMAVLPDPDDDEEVDVDAVEDDDAPDDADAIDLRAAAAALGDAPWRPSVLGRGLRHARHLARADFGPEALVDADGMDHPLGRARAMLRFVARHGDGLDAVLLARAAVGAGEAAFAPAAGFSGATARALAIVECALASLPPRWEALLDVVADPRARARVENVSAAVAENGGLSATALFEAVVGARVAPGEVDLVLSAHPAAIAALTTVARVEPLPLVDLWTPLARVATRSRDPVDALDAVLARFTGAPAPETGLGEADLGALFRAMNELLAAIGGALVEIAAAGVALAPHVPAPAIVGVLAPSEGALRRAARRVYTAGETLEGLVGTEEIERVRALSGEAVAVRATVDLARTTAFASLAALLVDTEAAAPELPELYTRAEAEAQAGRAAAARRFLDAAIVASPPELEGRVMLGAAGLLARLGMEDGRLGQAAELLGDGLLGAAARSLAAGAALAREEAAAAEAHAEVGGRVGREQGLVYVVADAACTVASARALGGGDWRGPLRDAAAWLRERGEGGALNLLKARWAELSAR